MEKEIKPGTKDREHQACLGVIARKTIRLVQILSEVESAVVNHGTTSIRDLACLIVSSGSVCLWFVGLWTERIWWVPASLPFGILQMISPLFWVALVIAIISLGLNFRSSSRLVSFLQLVALSVIINGTPVLVESNARTSDAWGHLAAIFQVLSSNTLPNPQTAPVTWVTSVLQTPGSFLFHAAFLQIANPPDVLAYLRLFPLISSTIFILGYYAWLGESVASARLTTIFVLLSNLWLNFYLGPQSYALMLLPLILLGMNRARTGPLGWRVAAVVFWLGLIVSHEPTSLFLLSIFWVDALIRRILVEKHVDFYFLLLLSGVFAFSAYYNSPSVLSEVLASVLRLLSGGIAISRASGLLSHPADIFTNPNFFPGPVLSSILRLAGIAAGTVGALLCVFLSMKKRLPEATLSFAWVIVCCLAVAQVVVTGEQGNTLAGYLVSRSLGLLFLLVPLILVRFRITSGTRRWIGTLLAVIPLVLSTIGFATIYYLENFYMISPTDIANASFVYAHSGTKISADANFSPYLTFGRNLDFSRLDGKPPPPDFGTKINGALFVFDDYSKSTGLAPMVTGISSMISAAPGTNRIYDSSLFADNLIS